MRWEWCFDERVAIDTALPWVEIIDRDFIRDERVPLTDYGPRVDVTYLCNLCGQRLNWMSDVGFTSALTPAEAVMNEDTRMAWLAQHRHKQPPLVLALERWH